MAGEFQHGIAVVVFLVPVQSDEGGRAADVAGRDMEVGIGDAFLFKGGSSSASNLRSEPVGASKCGALFIFEENAPRSSPKPSAAISATVVAVSTSDEPQAFIVCSHSGNPSGMTAGALSSSNFDVEGLSPIRQKKRHFASGSGGHSDLGLSVNWEASSHLGRAFSTPDGVTPTW